MPRRRVNNKLRKIKDLKFGSILIAKLINSLMFHGKKSVAEKIGYGALDILSESVRKKHEESLELALKHVRPLVEVRSRRVGGSTYQVPMEIRSIRRDTLAIRWIILSSRKRKEKSMILRLAEELKEAFHNKGNAVKKKEDMHRMAESNKAFSHYRW